MKKLYIIMNSVVFMIAIVAIIAVLNIKDEYIPISGPVIESIPAAVPDEVVMDDNFTPIRWCDVGVDHVEPVVKTEVSDVELMARVVHAEAGNQDDLGKRLIVDVILNRVDSNSFPDSISAVCTQRSQFAIWGSYTDEDMQAVIDELACRTDSEVVFFRTDYFHSFGVPAYQHGDHYFSKEDL